MNALTSLLALALAAQAAVVKPTPFTMYANKLFMCLVPTGWTIDVREDSGVSRLTASRPDGNVSLVVEMIPSKHSLYPTPEAFLKRRAKGLPVKERKLAKRWSLPAKTFEGVAEGRRQATAVLPLRNRSYYFVFSYVAAPAAFDQNSPEFRRLLTSFQFVPSRPAGGGR